MYVLLMFFGYHSLTPKDTLIHLTYYLTNKPYTPVFIYPINAVYPLGMVRY